MKIKPILILVLLVMANMLFAQSFTTDPVCKSELKQLEFIVGEWKGKGWMMGRDGTKSEFNQTENVQFKLDSTALLIEGVGKTNDIVTHNALALVTYNKNDSSYVFASYMQNGQKGEFKAELIENRLYWYPNKKVRYVIWLNDKGQWYEKGEYNNGEKWMQFFEMTLDKTN